MRRVLTPSPSAALPFFFLLIPPPPRSPLFPYTTLFRSRQPQVARVEGDALEIARGAAFRRDDDEARGMPRARRQAAPRSEEHTSELQSRRDLVCRLLLEKKKKKARG